MGGVVGQRGSATIFCPWHSLFLALHLMGQSGCPSPGIMSAFQVVRRKREGGEGGELPVKGHCWDRWIKPHQTKFSPKSRELGRSVPHPFPLKLISSSVTLLARLCSGAAQDLMLTGSQTTPRASEASSLALDGGLGTTSPSSGRGESQAGHSARWALSTEPAQPESTTPSILTEPQTNFAQAPPVAACRRPCRPEEKWGAMCTEHRVEARETMRLWILWLGVCDCFEKLFFFFLNCALLLKMQQKS